MTGIHRPMSQMRKLEAKETLFRTRKRILKYLVLGFLKQEGYMNSASALTSEASLTDEYTLCDNIDLDIILQKEALFRTRKRILKYLVLGFLKQEGYMNSASALTSEASLTDEYTLCDNIDLDIILQDYCSYYLIRFNKQPQFCKKVEEQPVKRPQTRRSRPEPEPEKTVSDPDLPATFTVTKLLKENLLANTDSTIPAVDRKPLSGLTCNMQLEKRQIAEYLYQDIIRISGVSWGDVKGLNSAKSILMESVVYPVKYPEMFTGILEPWRGVLLHGPPGSGKTMLARAVASESGCTFFNITCSSVVNKWRGESEKIVSVLFDLATYYAPSIIFMDEADCVTSQRVEHEASRRLTAQLLVELDGVRSEGRGVCVLLTTNVPWEIDPAMLRRLEKRIFIPLPDFSTRTALFEAYLSSKNMELVQRINFEELAAKTEGYSGSDIKLACKEALMSSVRKMIPSMGNNHHNRKDKITLSDILTAIEKTKPVSKNLEKKHEDWQNKMGSA